MMGEALLVAVVVIGIIVGCGLVATVAGLIFDETAMTQTQTLTFDGHAVTCDSATSVGNGACNARVTGLSKTPSATGYVVTATKKADKCDSRTSVGSGECNAKATVMNATDVAGIGLGGLLVILGLAVIFLLAIAGAFS